MNDLDLRAALHRDADLAGEPSPDLLDQLVRRRVHQRRRRAGVLTAALGVLVIGAGIPVGQSLLARSDAEPATHTVVVPTPTTRTPSVSPEASPTSVIPEPTTPETAAVSTPPAVDPDPPCDWNAMEAALPADTVEKTYRLARGDGELCSGDWAASGYTLGMFLDGTWVYDGEAGIFRYEDGSWVFHLRDDFCNKVTLPDVIWERACDVD